MNKEVIYVPLSLNTMGVPSRDFVFSLRNEVKSEVPQTVVLTQLQMAFFDNQRQPTTAAKHLFFPEAGSEIFYNSGKCFMSLWLYSLSCKQACTIPQSGYFLRGNYVPVNLASCFHARMPIWPSSSSGPFHQVTFQLSLVGAILVLKFGAWQRNY